MSIAESLRYTNQNESYLKNRERLLAARKNKISSSMSKENIQSSMNSSYADQHLPANRGKIIDHLEHAMPEHYRKKLEEIRRKYKDSKKLAGETKTLITSATPWGIFSLFSQINILTDWTYAAAILGAILKDVLDFTGIGSLPLIGSVITICCSIFIFFMMLLGNLIQVEHDRTVFQSYVIKKYGVLLVTTILELFFGLNFLPISTVGAFLIFLYALAARKGREKTVNS
jgi:magnesium-transporting ATPase (P-type)